MMQAQLGSLGPSLSEHRHTYRKAHEGVLDDSPNEVPTGSQHCVSEALAGESPVILSPSQSSSISS